MRTFTERVDFYLGHPDIHGGAVSELYLSLVVDAIVNNSQFPNREELITGWECDPIQLAGTYLTMGVKELIQHWDRYFTIKTASELRVNALGHLGLAGVRAQLDLVGYGAESDTVESLCIPAAYGPLLPEDFVGIETFSPQDMQAEWLKLRA